MCRVESIKRLLIAVALFAALSACHDPAAFRGSMPDLIPQQVGDFKLAGQATPLAPVAGKDAGDALRPTEGVNARYEAPGRGPIGVQVVNYPSAADAERARKKMQENFENLQKGSQLGRSPKIDKEGKTVGQKLTVTDFAPGIHGVIWTNGSLLYVVTGDDLKAIEELEHGLP